MLILGAPSDTVGFGGSAPDDCLYVGLNITRPGWTELKFDLHKHFKEKGKRNLNDVSIIELIMLRGSNPKTIYVDFVFLEK